MMTTPTYDFIKRGIDLVVGTVALTLSAPFQAVIAALVRWKIGSPVFFRQERPGKDEEIFGLVKFRTMLEPDPAAGLISDADRMTPFGAFLRSTSLDELPTLWNVVKGDMSLVGPRPLLVRYLDLYSPDQRRRHEVRPGLTGLAQVNGRNTISWGEKFRLDLAYVERRGPFLDAKIVLATVFKVLSRHGISAHGDVTMPEFRGTVATEESGNPGE